MKTKKTLPGKRKNDFCYEKSLKKIEKGSRILENISFYKQVRKLIPSHTVINLVNKHNSTTIAKELQHKYKWWAWYFNIFEVELTIKDWTWNAHHSGRLWSYGNREAYPKTDKTGNI